jgi:superfamily II DNA helicase RecQ
MKIEFFKDEKQAYWTAFIEYETVLDKNSNEPLGLTEAGKLCYEKLRQWRKETAEKEGIPAYVIAKNSHLGEIVKKEIKTLESLKQLNALRVKLLLYLTPRPWCLSGSLFNLELET